MSLFVYDYVAQAACQLNQWKEIRYIRHVAACCWRRGAFENILLAAIFSFAYDVDEYGMELLKTSK